MPPRINKMSEKLHCYFRASLCVYLSLDLNSALTLFDRGQDPNTQ